MTQKSAHLEDLIASVVTEFGIEMAEDSLEYATTHHLDAIRPHIEHDPDAREVLIAFRDRGLRIGLLSNTLWPEEFHEQLLEEAGLKDLIDARLYTSHMEYTKPHPEAFRAALRGSRDRRARPVPSSWATGRTTTSRALRGPASGRSTVRTSWCLRMTSSRMP